MVRVQGWCVSVVNSTRFMYVGVPARIPVHCPAPRSRLLPLLLKTILSLGLFYSRAVCHHQGMSGTWVHAGEQGLPRHPWRGMYGQIFSPEQPGNVNTMAVRDAVHRPLSKQ